MAPRRFKVDEVTAGVVSLTGPQAHHAIAVLRMAVGDEVIVFDGRGTEATGRIAAIEPAQVVVATDTPRKIARSGALTLAVATPKGERADWLVEKCTELGVTRLIPLRTDRGIVAPGAGKLDRWRRKAVEAAKQSQQAIAMEIHDECSINALLSEGSSLFFGSPDAAVSFSVALRGIDQAARITFIVGPEGGFTADELAALHAAGAMPVRLASPILRIETAAIAAAALWAAWKTGHFDGHRELS